MDTQTSRCRLGGGEFRKDKENDGEYFIIEKYILDDKLPDEYKDSSCCYQREVRRWKCSCTFLLTSCWFQPSLEPGKYDGPLMHEIILRKFDPALHEFGGAMISLF
jgi:hypothetical protein